VPDRVRKGRMLLGAACSGGVLCGLALATSTSCTTHDCDPSSSTFPVNTGDAGMTGAPLVTVLDGNLLLFQSSPVDGAWLSFPAMQTITVTYPSNFVDAFQWNVYVSTGQYQNEAGATATETSGQLAEFSNFTSSGFQLENASCSSYYVYFTVLGKQLPVLPEVDAGSEAGHD
jgi:hypothetical protein